MLRQQAAEEKDQEEKKQRLKALEELRDKGEVEQDVYEKMVRELGGEEGKERKKGLDFDALARARRGEHTDGADDVKEEDAEKEEEVPEDVDDEFEKVLGAEKEGGLSALQKKEKDDDDEDEVKKKKGNLAAAAGRRLTRDEIIRQMKAARAAAAGVESEEAQAQPQQAPEPSLGTRFKKIGADIPTAEKKRFVERDEKSGRWREVLLTTDKDGKAKRKVRWLKDDEARRHQIATGSAAEKEIKPLGADMDEQVAAAKANVAAAAPVQQEEDEDSDIFEGAGTDYNPLAGIEDGSSGSESDSDEGEIKSAKPKSTSESISHAQEDKPARPRDYFSTGKASTKAVEQAKNDRESYTKQLTEDPTILAAIKRAANLRAAQEQSETSDKNDGAPSSARHRLLEEAARAERLDAADMDMGFGSSRFGDEEDEDEFTREGLAEWGEEGKKEGGGPKRKRGKKKRKGDGEKAEDVMRVLEGRRK